VENVQDLPSDASPKIPRKRRTRADPSEEQLLEQFRTARRALTDLRKRTREQGILRLGKLAYNAGLAPFDDAILTDHFAELAIRLAGTESTDSTP
jgi:hypothetical protein